MNHDNFFGNSKICFPLQDKYIITEELINIIFKFNNYKNRGNNQHIDINQNNNHEDNTIIYLAYSDNIKYISYTNIDINYLIKINLYKKNIKKNNIFDNFKNIDMVNIIISPLELLNTRDDKIIQDIINKYENILEDTPVKNSNFYNNIKLLDLIKIKNVKYKEYEIIKIHNFVNNNKYIFAYQNKFTEEQLPLLINDNLNDITYDIIKKGIYRSKYELMLFADNEILNNNVTSNKISYRESDLLQMKLNKFNKQKLYKIMFLRIQEEIMNNEFIDKYDYSQKNNFIYLIKNKKSLTCVVYSNTKSSLKEEIQSLYNNSLNNIFHNTEIGKELSNFSYYDFIFKIVNFCDSNSLNKELNNYIKKYNSKNIDIHKN
jgi:predicted secreted protein